MSERLCSKASVIKFRSRWNVSFLMLQYTAWAVRTGTRTNWFRVCGAAKAGNEALHKASVAAVAMGLPQGPLLHFRANYIPPLPLHC